MLISTKGRYALRLMIELAQNQAQGYLSINEIAKKQQLSIKYLEAIARSLQEGKLITSMRGKRGGYILNRKPAELSLGEIITISQGGLSVVECQAVKNGKCIMQNDCLTKQLWIELDSLINNYFNNLTLQDLIDSKRNETGRLNMLGGINESLRR